VRLYEGMFLAEAGKAKDNLDDIRDEIKETLSRFGAEVINCEKWDERRLAYPIKQEGVSVRRGFYLLSHFNAPPESITKIDRAFRISENILRFLITHDEDGTEIPQPVRVERDDGYGKPRRERGDKDKRGDRPRGGDRD
jgi:small subunit ribosomal protein S6